ncbi:type II secretion system protein [Clostridium aestuarii]|uniref:Type II secretion system protein n=1 Tax=Clostridium aestuarii TaxID=338193 RepID=A0ABT4CXL4_9CLOT|nr:type II secretion system protein [Clostridium aestuarii]MCY6483739.1 type II secretion system protein [Clostridium aestuarii]
MRKRKGFTLLEVVIVLSIIGLIGSFTVVNYYKIYNNSINDLNTDLCNNSILHMINDSKLYCRNISKHGHLLFNHNDNTIIFHCNSKKIQTYNFPKGFKLEYLNTADGVQLIRIDEFGNTSNACSIKFTDMKGEIHKVTLRVATNYVEIKEK